MKIPKPIIELVIQGSLVIGATICSAAIASYAGTGGLTTTAILAGSAIICVTECKVFTDLLEGVKEKVSERSTSNNNPEVPPQIFKSRFLQRRKAR